MVEVGATFVRNLCDYDFWVALPLVITNRDGKRGSLGGWGKYGGSKLRPQASDLCGGDRKQSVVYQVTTWHFAMNLMRTCTVWVFWSVTPKLTSIL